MDAHNDARLMIKERGRRGDGEAQRKIGHGLVGRIGPNYIIAICYATCLL